MTLSAKMRLRVLFPALVLLAASAAGCGGLGRKEPPVQVPEAKPGSEAGSAAPAGGAKQPEVQPIPGYKAADILARDVVTGKQVALSDLRGQVVMLNFWATWCGPCRLEMPAMEKFQADSRGKVKIVALGADSGESPEQLAAFGKDLNLSFTMAHDAGAAALAYRILGIPTTLFIDQNGIIRSRHTGPLTLNQMQQLAAETEQMGRQQ